MQAIYAEATYISVPRASATAQFLLASRARSFVRRRFVGEVVWPDANRAEIEMPRASVGTTRPYDRREDRVMVDEVVSVRAAWIMKGPQITTGRSTALQPFPPFSAAPRREAPADSYRSKFGHCDPPTVYR